jgi:hypothetical protein
VVSAGLICLQMMRASLRKIGLLAPRKHCSNYKYLKAFLLGFHDLRIEAVCLIFFMFCISLHVATSRVILCVIAHVRLVTCE